MVKIINSRMRMKSAGYPNDNGNSDQNKEVTFQSKYFWKFQKIYKYSWNPVINNWYERKKA